MVAAAEPGCGSVARYDDDDDDEEAAGGSKRRVLVMGAVACVVGLGAWGGVTRADDLMRLASRYGLVSSASAKTAGSAANGGQAKPVPALPTVNGRDATIVVITPRR